MSDSTFFDKLEYLTGEMSAAIDALDWDRLNGLLSEREDLLQALSEADQNPFRKEDEDRISRWARKEKMNLSRLSELRHAVSEGLQMLRKGRAAVEKYHPSGTVASPRHSKKTIPVNQFRNSGRPSIDGSPSCNRIG
jgi:hypothetical protein